MNVGDVHSSKNCVTQYQEGGPASSRRQVLGQVLGEHLLNA